MVRQNRIPKKLVFIASVCVYLCRVVGSCVSRCIPLVALRQVLYVIVCLLPLLPLPLPLPLPHSHHLSPHPFFPPYLLNPTPSLPVFIAHSYMLLFFLSPRFLICLPPSYILPYYSSFPVYLLPSLMCLSSIYS